MPHLLSVRLFLGGAMLTGLVAAGQAAIELDIGPLAIEEALRLARSPESERARFHASYLLSVTEPLVEKLEIIKTSKRTSLAVRPARSVNGRRLLPDYPDGTCLSGRPHGCLDDGRLLSSAFGGRTTA